MVDHEGTLRIENDDISMKSKLISTQFGAKSEALKINEKIFCNTSTGLKPYWDYRHFNDFHVESPGVYTNE